MEVKTVELVINTRDEQFVSEINKYLSPEVTGVRGSSTRALDVVSILVTATAAVKLITALIDLRNKWRAGNHKPDIKVRNEMNDMNLLEASDEMIKQFVGES